MPVTAPSRQVAHKARGRGLLAAAVYAVIRSLPPWLRTGFALLAFGLLLDAGYHVAIGAGDHQHGTRFATASFAIHGVIIAGMVLSLMGVAATAFHGPNERSTKRR